MIISTILVLLLGLGVGIALGYAWGMLKSNE